MSRSLSYSPTVFFSPVFSHSLGLLVIPLVDYMIALYLVILKSQSNENHTVTDTGIDVINNSIGYMLVCLFTKPAMYMEVMPRLRQIVSRL